MQNQKLRSKLSFLKFVLAFNFSETITVGLKKFQKLKVDSDLIKRQSVIVKKYIRTIPLN